MSRSGYTEDYDDSYSVNLWYGAVKSATRGKRGQAMLRDLLAALDAMPDKRLTTGALQDEDGCVCALGALGVRRGLDISDVDPEDVGRIAAMFNIADALAREIMWLNDETGRNNETPERRWERMRKEIASMIKQEP